MHIGRPLGIRTLALIGVLTGLFAANQTSFAEESPHPGPCSVEVRGDGDLVTSRGTMAYDSAGNLITSDVELLGGGVVYSSYRMQYSSDSQGRLLEERQDNSRDGTIDMVTTRTYAGDRQVMIRVSRQEEVVEISYLEYAHDGSSAVERIDREEFGDEMNLDGVIDTTVTMTFDADGNLTSQVSRDADHIDCATSAEHRWIYEGGHLTREESTVETCEGVDSGTNILEYTVGPEGRRTEARALYRPLTFEGEPTPEPELNQTTVYTYDEAGNPLTEVVCNTFDECHTTRYDYSCW